jgi:nitrite reductase/ring-hydroxylating ferredoxin subunit
VARVRVCSSPELEKESARALDVGDLRLALFRNSDGEFYATQDSCTHEQWSLGEDGDLDGNEVTCPLHLACFDIRTGAALFLPATEPLTTYPVEVDEDDNVYVLIED